MTDGVEFNPALLFTVIPQWRTQAAQMRSVSSSLGVTTTGGLPASTAGAAQTFLDMWHTTTRTAAVAADVYADELESTGTSYQNIDTEIARRMDAMGGGVR